LRGANEGFGHIWRFAESLLQHARPKRESGGNRAHQALWRFNQAQGQSMRRILRKSMPFVWALLIGTLAGVMVAGLAVFAAHS
jgi:hypothetical protein